MNELVVEFTVFVLVILIFTASLARLLHREDKKRDAQIEQRLTKLIKDTVNKKIAELKQAGKTEGK